MSVALHPDEAAVLLSVARYGRNVTRSHLAVDTGIDENRVPSVVSSLSARGLLDIELDAWDRVLGYRIVKWPNGLRRPDGRCVTRQRQCLLCLAWFKSHGAGNRICCSCKGLSLFGGAEA